MDSKELDQRLYDAGTKYVRTLKKVAGEEHFGEIFTKIYGIVKSDFSFDHCLTMMSGTFYGCLFVDAMLDLMNEIDADIDTLEEFAAFVVVLGSSPETLSCEVQKAMYSAWGRALLNEVNRNLIAIKGKRNQAVDRGLEVSDADCSEEHERLNRLGLMTPWLVAAWRYGVGFRDMCKCIKCLTPKEAEEFMDKNKGKLAEQVKRQIGEDVDEVDLSNASIQSFYVDMEGLDTPNLNKRLIAERAHAIAELMVHIRKPMTRELEYMNDFIEAYHLKLQSIFK